MEIPTLTYACLANGRSVKQVTCENCSKTYFYEQIEIGESQAYVGFGTDSKMAQKEAGENLQKRLDVPLVVPCPQCGQIQEDMIPIAQGERMLWLRLVGFIFYSLSAVCGLGAVIGILMWISESIFLDRADGARLQFTLLCGSVSLVIAAVGFGTFRLWGSWTSQHDPNGEGLTARIELGRRLAFDETTAKRKLLFPQSGTHIFACECGEPIPVRLSQAGAKTQCPDCDQEIVIPTLDAIQNLPRASVGFWEKQIDDCWES